MSQVDRAIAAFGGLRPLARALNLPPSNIQTWKIRGFIPAKYHQIILERARAANIPFGIEELLGVVSVPAQGDSPSTQASASKTKPAPTQRGAAA